MKRHVVITLCIFLAMFLLAACERPAPRADNVQVEDVPPATVDVVVPLPATATDEPEVIPDPTDSTDEPAPGQPGEGEATAVPAEPTPEPTTGPQVHTVRAGDTLFTISQQYGVSVEEIAQANNITNVNVLEVGQQLTIPAPGTVAAAPTAAPEPAAEEQIHVVQAGENLFRIGLRYGFTVDELAAYNGITNVNVLEVGQQIRIPPRQ